MMMVVMLRQERLTAHDQHKPQPVVREVEIFSGQKSDWGTVDSVL